MQNKSVQERVINAYFPVELLGRGITNIHMLRKDCKKVIPLKKAVTLLLCVPSDDPLRGHKLILSGSHLDVTSEGIRMRHRGF